MLPELPVARAARVWCVVVAGGRCTWLVWLIVPEMVIRGHSPSQGHYKKIVPAETRPWAGGFNFGSIHPPGHHAVYKVNRQDKTTTLP